MNPQDPWKKTGIEDVTLRKPNFTKKKKKKWYSSGKQPRNNTGKGQGMNDMYLEIFDLRPQPSHLKYVFKCFTKKPICFISNVTISKMNKNCQKNKASYPSFWCFPSCLREEAYLPEKISPTDYYISDQP